MTGSQAQAAPFSWGSRTLVMAIINATPDSFSGDGIGHDRAAAQGLATAAVAAGADIIDIGAESTRPGHQPITAKEELARLLPLLRAIRPTVGIPISVDTSKAAVAEASIQAGADLVNDVRGFTQDPEIAAVVAKAGIPAVLMHDVPSDGRGDLISSVIRELASRLDRAAAAGVAWENLIIDPGFGFGKTWQENLLLLRRLEELTVLGCPIMVGMSRKSTIGRVLGLPSDDRLEGTIATTVTAIAAGADIIRVHDVRPNVRAAKMADAIYRRIPDQPLSWPGE